MLIIGAKGFAKEVLEVLHQLDDIENLVFYDDVNKNISEKLFGEFPVLKSIEEAKFYFKTIDNRFTIGVGEPKTREVLYNKFNKIGGKMVSTISPFASLGHYGNIIKNGTNLMTGVIITNDIKIGKGCLINLNCTIGHDCVVDDFVELSPNVNISGNCKIGKYTVIGTNAVLLPKILIGENCIIGAGSVITKNIPDNSVVVGIPGKIIKQNI